MNIFLVSKIVLGEDIVIVEQNQPRAVIVIPPNEDKQLERAVYLLQNYIKVSTGVTINVVRNEESKLAKIHVGKTNFAIKKKINLRTIGRDGFIFQSFTNDFIILGNSALGTEFGVYEFMERYIGVRWLMPTMLGTDIPQKNEISIPAIKQVFEPAFLSRNLSPADIFNENVLGRWARYNRLNKTVEVGHNLNNLFNVDQYGISNPDFYPLINGKRYIPNDKKDYKWQPNFTEQGIVDSASKKIIHFLRMNIGMNSYSLSINDYRDNLDESSASLKFRTQKKNSLGLTGISNEFFSWANQVAENVLKEFPSVKFGALAYTNVFDPPSSKIGVNSSIVPFLTNERSRWNDVVYRNKDIELTKSWSVVANSIGWYDYVYGRNYVIPRVWPHSMKDYLKWANENGVKYYNAEFYPNWGEGPKGWVLSKLLWNPNQNIDNLLDEWYSRFAGEKAAPKLKEYFEIWETFWTTDVFKSKWYNSKRYYQQFLDISYLKDVPDSYVERSSLLLKEAYEDADTPTRKQRVAAIMRMWDLYFIAIRYYKKNPGIVQYTSLKNSKEFVEKLNAMKDDPLHKGSIGYLTRELNK